MIIDCHTHLGFTADREAADYWGKNHRIPDRIVDPFVQAMETVDRAILLGIEWQVPNIGTNECVAQFMREHGDKFVPFYNIYPSAPTAISDLRRAVQEWGAKGVKLCPIYNNFKPDDERYFPFYEEVQRLKLPTLWHQGTSAQAPDGPLEWANPVLLDKVARSFPELKIVIAHFGYPWIRETVALVRKRPNVYTEVSALVSALGTRTWALYNALVEAVQYHAEHKVFFGSDYPECPPAFTRDALQQISAIPEGTNLPAVPQSVIDGIISRNCLEILGIG